MMNRVPATSAAGPRKLTKRERLHRKDPSCFWCGRETLLTTKSQSNTATIDHLYSKLHHKRPGNGHLQVLACYKCNQDRSNAEHSGEPFVPLLAARAEIAVETTAPWVPQEMQKPPPRNRKPPSLRVRNQLPEDEPRFTPLTSTLQRQFRCWYCGTQVIDGTRVVSGQMCSCDHCKEIKGRKSREEFRAFIKAQLGTAKPIVFFGEWNYFLRKRTPPADGLVIDGGLPAQVRAA